MKTEYPYKNLWAIIGKNKYDYPLLSTVSSTRNECIKKFLSGRFTWPEARKYGWKAIKIDVSIKPMTPEPTN